MEMDIQKPAYRARLRVKADKHAKGPPKASTEHDHKSKPTSTPIDLRKPDPSYDDRTIDILSTQHSVALSDRRIST